MHEKECTQFTHYRFKGEVSAGGATIWSGMRKKKHLNSVWSCNIPAFPITHSTLSTTAIHHSVFVKGHLGCYSLDAPVVRKSGDGNACWPACCHPDGGGGGTAGATCDRRLMGKHCLQTPTSNLLIINQQQEMTHKITHSPFYSTGHLNRLRINKFHPLLLRHSSPCGEHADVNTT